ncbi:MAG: class I SAM-dependent methyltransferase [Bacteroidota bacterium]
MPDSPFSAIALRYDEQFSNLPGVAHVRNRMHALAVSSFLPGGRILDLGCGTGIDAVRLAREGFQVTAADAAAGMLERAASRAASEGVQLMIRTLDATDLSSIASGSFDGVFSNFGVLNCIGDLSKFFLHCHRILAPAGSGVLSFLGRWAPWEIAAFLIRGDRRSAFRRRSNSRVAVPMGTGSVPVWYPGWSTIRDAAAPYFTHVSSFGLNVISPPPSSTRFVESCPKTSAFLWRVEARVSHLFPLSRGGDHIAFLLRKKP